MNKLIIDRRIFWIVIAIWVLGKAVLVFAIESYPGSLQTLRAVETGLTVTLAFSVGGRFADFGWSRWLGIGLTFLIFVILPMVVLLGDYAVFGLPKPVPGDPLSVIPDHFGWMTLLLMVPFVLWAGTRPSIAADT
jgi:hypothetical protein